MVSKSNIAILVFGSLLAFVILSNCTGLGKLAPAYHKFTETAQYKALSRAEQNKKCAECHKKEYENELAGPHANAYTMLKEHRDFINTDKYNCPFYTERINTHFEDCVTCHSPQNLFETKLFDSTGNTKNILANLRHNALPAKREGEAIRAGGIDCISCHYNGKDMVSLKHEPSAADKDPQAQTPDVIALNNMVCYPCHFDILVTINPQMAIQNTGMVLCNSCHQDYDAKGKGTHYTHWKHDAKGKVSPKALKMMADFSFEAGQGNTGKIVWKNTTIPHKVGMATEMLVKCDILSKDSVLLGSKTVRINRKKDFDKEMYEQYGKRYLDGIVGDSVLTDGSAIKHDIELKGKASPKLLRISLIHKAQFWFPDSLGVLSTSVIKEIK